VMGAPLGLFLYALSVSLGLGIPSLFHLFVRFALLSVL